MYNCLLLLHKVLLCIFSSYLYGRLGLAHAYIGPMLCLYGSLDFCYTLAMSGGVVVLPLTSHAKDWVIKSSLRQAVQATKL